MKKVMKTIDRATLQRVLLSAFVVLFFLGIIGAYYAMLRGQMEQTIFKSGELSTVTAAEQINEYLSTGIDMINLECFSLNNMIRSGKSQEEIQEFLINQSIAIASITEEASSGIYAYVNGEYLDGAGWEPGDDYVATERPWYIGAQANIGRVAVIDPYIDAETNTVMLTLSKTLCDAKSVAAIDFTMNQMQEIVENLAGQGNSDMEIVLDQRYRVIAHSQRAEVGKDYLAEEGTIWHMLVEQLRSSEEGHIAFRYGGKNYIAYSIPVMNDWLSISVLDATSEFNRLQHMLMLTIAAALLVVFVLTFILVRLNQRALIARQLNEKTVRAIAANEAKSHFLANMSHEIRTPLNGILGMDEMILRSTRESATRKYALNIKSAGTTLLSIINDILDVNKIESGNFEIFPSDYDVASICNDVINITRPRAVEKSLEYRFTVAEDIPSILYGDSLRVQQIMLNVINNAIKYTREGFVEVSVTGAVNADSSSCVLTLRVSDSGIGIKEEDKAKLFQSFQRLDEKRNRSIEGTGLGLHITQLLIDMMDGTITVESEYGKGSTFTVSVPQRVIRPEPIGDFSKAVSNFMAQPDTNAAALYAPAANVLVVDDNEMNLKVIEGLLRDTKIKLKLVTSGFQCIEQAKKRSYDCILLDQMMPEMSGEQALQELRKMGIADETPIIALTADAVVGAKESYLAMGFTDYLSKPVKYEQLEKMLMMYLPAEKQLTPRAASDERPVILVWGDNPESLKGEKERLGGIYKCVCVLGRAAMERYLEKHRPDGVLYVTASAEAEEGGEQ